MMPVFLKFLKNLKQANREYVLLGMIIILVGFLICATTGITQAPPEQIEITTYYPAPFGEYLDLRARRMYDFDNIGTYCDPAGTSLFTSVQVTNGIIATVIRSNAGTYSINFNSGNAYLNNVTVDGRFTMGASGPTDQRTGGKFVYDLAEGMIAKDCLPADVVIIDEGEGLGLARSTQKFDARVAGVISSDPKIYMGPQPDHQPLALAGIVKCNVSAENGAIKRGDLLVTSSLPGHAMRAEAKEVKPGMLIGKALQEHKQGNGQIYILVNKQ